MGAKDRSKQLREGKDENYLDGGRTTKTNACEVVASKILIMELTIQVKVAMKMVFAK